ncbi:MAG: DUF1289 domain-containing protein [Pseudomonadota bacterium]|nr:DUF1289 domain-containing protein [Pseudomonadota bacterium]
MYGDPLKASDAGQGVAVEQGEDRQTLHSAIGQVRARALTLKTQAPVPSPCISVCRMSADSGLCEGCFRTRDEIAGWSRASEEGKRRLWATIEQRMAALVS